MEPVKLKGVQIIDAKRQMRSGLMRYVIELNEQDSKMFAGSMAVAAVNQVLADVTFNFTEVQGNDNGSEDRMPSAGDAEIPGFAGTMEALNDLSIRPQP